MNKKAWKDTEVVHLKSLYEEGMKSSFIAKKLGRSTASVDRALCRYGFRKAISISSQKKRYKIRGDHTFPLTPILPFAHHSLYEGFSLWNKSLIPTSGVSFFSSKVTSQQDTTKENFEDFSSLASEETTNDLVLWLNRYTSFKVHIQFSQKLKTEIYQIINQKGEKKFLSKMGLLELTRRYRKEHYKTARVASHRF